MEKIQTNSVQKKISLETLQEFYKTEVINNQNRLKVIDEYFKIKITSYIKNILKEPEDLNPYNIMNICIKRHLLFNHNVLFSFFRELNTDYKIFNQFYTPSAQEIFYFLEKYIDPINMSYMLRSPDMRAKNILIYSIWSFNSIDSTLFKVLHDKLGQKVFLNMLTGEQEENIIIWLPVLNNNVKGILTFFDEYGVPKKTIRRLLTEKINNSNNIIDIVFLRYNEFEKIIRAIDIIFYGLMSKADYECFIVSEHYKDFFDKITSVKLKELKKIDAKNMLQFIVEVAYKFEIFIKMVKQRYSLVR